MILDIDEEKQLAIWDILDEQCQGSLRHEHQGYDGKRLCRQVDAALSGDDQRQISPILQICLYPVCAAACKATALTGYQ